jgi:phosphatidylinositol glycan class V
MTKQIPRMRAIIKTITLAAIVIAPFIAYHFVAYVVFCSETRSSPTWCSQFPPSIYTHVQSTYWNVGFLRYWTLSQLPNFLLAAPTLLVILTFSLHHLKGTGLGSSKRKPEPRLHCAFQNATITPHAIHGIIFSFILIFASHTQIVLRLAASMPLVYWAAAWLLSEHPAIGRLWVTWSLLWGITSVICWATFLPPA